MELLEELLLAPSSAKTPRPAGATPKDISQHTRSPAHARLGRFSGGEGLPQHSNGCFMIA